MFRYKVEWYRMCNMNKASCELGEAKPKAQIYIRRPVQQCSVCERCDSHKHEPPLHQAHVRYTYVQGRHAYVYVNHRVEQIK